MSGQYEPVGRCIYCGASENEAKLGNEHIVAYALGGNVVLPKASCRSCEAATSKVELKVCREMLLVHRTKSGVQTRRRSERPVDFPLDVFRSGDVSEVRVPFEDYPVDIYIPSLGLPGLLVGDAERQDWEGIEIKVIAKQKFGIDGADRIRTKMIIPGGEFARMIAKMAHAFAVAELGIQAFEPYLCEFIREGRGFAASLVGGLGSRPPSRAQDANGCHELDLRVVRNHGRHLLLARIQLFAHLGMPIHQAVVGEVAERSKKVHSLAVPIGMLGGN